MASPAHDTFERMFARLRPEQLQQCFLNWVQAVFNITDGQLINLDGKTLRFLGAIASFSGKIEYKLDSICVFIHVLY